MLSRNIPFRDSIFLSDRDGIDGTSNLTASVTALKTLVTLAFELFEVAVEFAVLAKEREKLEVLRKIRRTQFDRTRAGLDDADLTAADVFDPGGKFVGTADRC